MACIAPLCGSKVYQEYLKFEGKKVIRSDSREAINTDWPKPVLESMSILFSSLKSTLDGILH